jgi:hypothetical protein
MLKLSDIKQMVETDMKIDPTTLDRESLNIPQLHNKYLCIMIDEKLILKKQESDLAILRKNKWLYYLGKMSEEQLNELGWEAFELAITRQDVDRFMESDSDYITLSNKVELQKEKINYLENIIKSISNRIWNIRAAIDWHKFTQGQ